MRHTPSFEIPDHGAYIWKFKANWPYAYIATGESFYLFCCSDFAASGEIVELVNFPVLFKI